MKKAKRRNPNRGRVMKVISLDEKGNKTGEIDFSAQIPEDPFGTYSHGLMEPPFPVEQLIFLAEQHPTHAPALDQKAADVIGTGWEWREKSEDSNPPDKQREQLEEWVQGLNDPRRDETAHETLHQAVLDMETVGYGCVELAREKTAAKKLRHWYYMPAHTVRFHRDGVRVCQVRGGKRRWFKRWIPDDDRLVDKFTGALSEPGEKDVEAKIPNPANEVLVVKRPSRRSSWYGIPTYVSAIGWIALSLAARDDNLMFFSNRREPRWAVILSNLEDDPDLEESLRSAFQVDLKQPHRNLLIPISGPGEIEFKQLSDNKGDMSFEKLQIRSDVAILLAHKMPSERIGLSKTGALGGNVTEASVQTYKEAVVQTTQATLSARINRLIEHEADIKNLGWLWHPKELDLTDREADLASAVTGFQGNVLKLDEARERAGEEALDEKDERGEKFSFELIGPGAAQGDPFGPMTDDLNAQLEEALGPAPNDQPPEEPPEEQPPPKEKK